jgi:hypothetical protein
VQRGDAVADELAHNECGVGPLHAGDRQDLPGDAVQVVGVGGDPLVTIAAMGAVIPEALAADPVRGPPVPAAPVRGRPCKADGPRTAPTPRTPSAMRPWTPQRSGLQRYKVTHAGTEQKRPA